MSSDIGRDRYDDGGPRPGADAPAGSGEPQEPGPAPMEASEPPTQAMPAATPPAPAPTQATPVAGSDQQQAAVFDRRPTADSMDPDAGRGSPNGAIAAERNYSDTSAYRPEAALDAESLYLREHHAYGGVRLGSAFFGWLTAAGLIVLFTSVVVGVAAAFGMANEAEVRGWLDNIAESSGAAAITAGVALGVIVLLAYFGGGYVAGRMARFDGVRQGLAVWLWGIVMSVIAGLIGLAAGGLGVLTGPAPVPVVGRPIQELTFPGLIGLAVVLLASLAGALLGGAAGMHYHRAVDRSGFEPDEDIE
ncbi:hypothetical protein [Arthrobacter sulfonylureivorans]|uniref:Major facilitator superfamily (MFS) profile domain-containing protein n=1 Tax=Arthrobacter sulfonylureivorans TaxID=2486855 RepID=A0ABY3W833_9MICC|nr:hypothetical protein [Arthrobacter sulfonylureivorans]UNK46498.1 hypothetical protein MNQ99_03785 [Arthrobacter sulfonylureivorans]